MNIKLKNILKQITACKHCSNCLLLHVDLCKTNAKSLEKKYGDIKMVYTKKEADEAIEFAREWSGSTWSHIRGGSGNIYRSSPFSYSLKGIDLYATDGFDWGWSTFVPFELLDKDMQDNIIRKYKKEKYEECIKANSHGKITCLILDEMGAI